MTLGQTSKEQNLSMSTESKMKPMSPEQHLNHDHRTQFTSQPDKMEPDIDFKTDVTISFLRAARNGDLAKVIEFLEHGEIRDINASNANGLNALHLAAKDGYTDIVKELLSRGINVNNATKKGNTALHIASLAGQKNVLKLLIQYNANVNVQSLNGFTPLYMAAQENHDECVRLLLSKGANPSLATEDGFTPLAVAMQQGHDKVAAVLLETDLKGKVRLPALHIAAKKNDMYAAKLLLKNDKSPDIVSKSGFTPLHIASHYGNIEVAQLLIERGADVNFTAKHNITPLHVACKWGKSKILDLLLSQNANINAATRDGLTPLHCAARSGHVDVIKVLLEHNAPILAKTKNGLSALHMAAQGDHDAAALILLNHKSPVDEVTIDYLTPLHVTAHCGHLHVAKTLLDFNANPNARALNGFTPLHIACKKNRVKMVDLLLKNSANISATTESGLSALHVASFMGCINIAIYLLQHNANPDSATIRGETSLHLAARANQSDIIRILLRNGATVNARAREAQTPLHVAARLGNVDIVTLLLQNGADVNSCTKDLYTALHISAREGHENVCLLLIEHSCNINAATVKGFTPLHLAVKYGKEKLAMLLIEKGAEIDAKGKNDVTPLHVAVHYEHKKLVSLLLEKGASPLNCAKNGHTALHIAAKKNQFNICQCLLKYGANVNAHSKSGFTPLHMAIQEGNTEIVRLFIGENVDVNASAKNGLTPLHLVAQKGLIDIAHLLLEKDADLLATTSDGFTPLHVAAHYGQINLVKLLLEKNVKIDMSTNVGYTPLHHAAQQGHTMVIQLLLRSKANPNSTTNSGHTALSIAQNLGYITAVETLKAVTDTEITDTTYKIVTEKIKIAVPEQMHESFFSDSDDEGLEEHLDHHQYKYMANDDLKVSSEQDHQQYNTTESNHDQTENLKVVKMGTCLNQHNQSGSENVANTRIPVHLGFLVSFLVDARGGSMRGCRHSGVRVVVAPRSCTQPTRITCRYVKPQKVNNLPPLMEGEALVSRILELSPMEATFLSPVLLEIPHFGALRKSEREIIILRSDNGESWREHSNDGHDSYLELLSESTGMQLNSVEELNNNRIVRIITRDFPHFFAIISRIRQEIYVVGQDGGTITSQTVPLVQAIFPPNALTKKIRVGLQAQPVDLKGCCKLLGQGVAVSPVVTVEPRRRKFHKAITLIIPAPTASTQSMVNSTYNSNVPTMRLLCSITGGQNRAIWEDVTGSTPLTFVKGSVTFTTTVSARFWLMDCRNVADSSRMATELYSYMIRVPFLAKFIIYCKRISSNEAKLSVFCISDDKEEKTLEQQESFIEIARSSDLELFQDQQIYLDFSGNVIPILKTGEQLNFKFSPFSENRLSFLVHLKDSDDPCGFINFMNEAKLHAAHTLQESFCTLNLSINRQNENIVLQHERFIEYNNVDGDTDSKSTKNNNFFSEEINEARINQLESEKINVHRAELKLSELCNLLGNDWIHLAKELNIPETDIDLISNEFTSNTAQQALIMFQLWMRQTDMLQKNGNTIEKALKKIGRDDVIDKCISNLKLISDYKENEDTQILDFTTIPIISENFDDIHQGVNNDDQLNISHSEESYNDIRRIAEENLNQVFDEAIKNVEHIA